MDGIYVPLGPRLKDALLAASKQAYRTGKEQAVYYIVQGLQADNALPPVPTEDQPAPAAP
jgi:hypothetical protein